MGGQSCEGRGEGPEQKPSFTRDREDRRRGWKAALPHTSRTRPPSPGRNSLAPGAMCRTIVVTEACDGLRMDLDLAAWGRQLVVEGIVAEGAQETAVIGG